MARSKRRTSLAAASLLAALAVGACAGSSESSGSASRVPSEPAETSSGETQRPVGGEGIELLDKRKGAPAEPLSAYVWVGWAETEQELQDLWASFRLEGDPPDLSAGVVLLAATGESGSCPLRMTEASVESDTLQLSLVDKPADASASGESACTADFNPVTFVLGIERDLVEATRVVDFGDTQVALGPAGQINSADYFGN